MRQSVFEKKEWMERLREAKRRRDEKMWSPSRQNGILQA